MSTLQTDIFASKPIIPMRPAKYIKNPPKRRIARRIMKRPHLKGCAKKDIHLTCTIINKPDRIGKEYYLTCKTCKSLIGKMFLEHGANYNLEINNFIQFVTTR